MEFKVPNLAAYSHINTLCAPTSPTPGSLRKTAKCITFCDPPLDLHQPHSASLPQGQGGLRKTTLKVSYSDPVKTTINSTQCKKPPTTPSQPLPALNHHSSPAENIKPKPPLKMTWTKATSSISITVVQDIISLKQDFPDSFNTIDNMSRTYTIRTDPSVTPVQHAWWRSPSSKGAYRVHI